MAGLSCEMGKAAKSTLLRRNDWQYDDHQYNHHNHRNTTHFLPMETHTHTRTMNLSIKK
jgi:hypothetical protein